MLIFMVNIHKKFKHIIFQGCMLYPDKELDVGAGIGQTFGNRCGIDRSKDIIGKGLPKKDWESEESDIRGYLVGNPILY